MRLDEIRLVETIDNFFINDKQGREKYADQVWEILQQSYASIGGIKGSGFKSKEDMIEKIPMWKIWRQGDTVKIVMMYKGNQAGRKRVAMGTDGSPEAKKMLAKMVKDEYTQGRAFGEISGSSLKFIKRILGDEFKNILIPTHEIKNILTKDWEEGNIKIIDDENYERKISGHYHPKVMVGTPGQHIT